MSTCVTAGPEENRDLLQAARSIVAQELSISTDEIPTSDLRNPKDAFVCGHVLGKRFIVNMDPEFRKPIIEDDSRGGARVFNFAWNLQCEGMEESKALAKLDQDIDVDTCRIKDWNWREFGTRAIRIQGVTACRSGRILLKAYDGEKFLGYDTAPIQAGAFTIYIDGRPTGDSVRIEPAFAK